MSQEAVARRYARALFELGKESGSLPTLMKDMTSFAETWSGSAELRDVLGNPLVPEDSREAILKDIGQRLALSALSVNALRLLTRRGRLAALPDLVAQLGRLADDDAKIVRADVTSAAPLSATYVKRLKDELEKATGRKVELTCSVDPSIIAGVVTKIGDRVIDGSARARLSSFRESLLRS